MTLTERAALLKAQTATLNNVATHFQAFHKLFTAAMTLAAQRKAETMTDVDFHTAIGVLAYQMVYSLWDLENIPDASTLPTP